MAGVLIGEHGLVESWDVVVIGAGPAGTAAALAARRRRPQARVLLLDRHDFPRDKPCGDGVAPQAFDVLHDLGVDGVDSGYGEVGSLVVEGPGGAVARRRMARPARVIPRSVLDARLADAAVEAGAVLRRHTVRTLEIGSDGVVVDGRIHARAVIGADGANGVTRRAIGIDPQPVRHLAVAIRGYAVDGSGEQVPTQVIRMDAEDRWPAYAWSFPLNDGTGGANVGWGTLVDRRRPVSRDEMLDRLRRTIPWAVDARELRAHHLPLSSHRPHQPDGPVVLVGDAASLVNPFTGEGIFYAVLSGAVAGEVAVSCSNPGAAHRRRMHRRLGRHHVDASLLTRFVRRPRLVDAGIHAAGTTQRAFDDIVALGLADGRLTGRLLLGTARSLVSGRA